MEKCIIAAVARNGAIGKDNQLLWHISADLKYFRKTTMGCPVIMGRKTFESVGRPLPGRLNIVVSRGFDAPEGVVVVKSLEEAFACAQAEIDRKAGKCEETGKDQNVNCPHGNGGRCFIIGGGSIYAAALPLADKLFITHVYADPDADTFFPEVDPELWTIEEITENQTDPESGLDYAFAVYGRI